MEVISQLRYHTIKSEGNLKIIHDIVGFETSADLYQGFLCLLSQLEREHLEVKTVSFISVLFSVPRTSLGK